MSDAHGPAETEWHLRPATVMDFDAVLHLLRRFYAEEGFDPDDARLTLRLRDFLSDTDRNAIMLAVSGGRIIGFASVSVCLSLEYGRFAEIDDLYLEPKFRRRGIGQALMDGAWRWATEVARCSCVSIVVTPEAESRHGLVGYYTRQGYTDSKRHILYRLAEDRRCDEADRATPNGIIPPAASP